MSYNQRLSNLQKNVSTNELKNADLDFIEKFVSATKHSCRSISTFAILNNHRNS